MNPLAMLCLIVGFLAMFAWSAHRRWQLLATGRPENRLDHIKERIQAVWRYAFVQEKMDYYQPAGLAHKLIFAGFVLLLFRILMLWGRGFSPTFALFVLGMSQPLGAVYEFIKDTITTGVLCGVAVFFYYRVLNPLKRITRHWEGTLILGIIATMMLADMIYDGAAFALGDRAPYLCGPDFKRGPRSRRRISARGSRSGSRFRRRGRSSTPTSASRPSPAGSIRRGHPARPLAGGAPRASRRPGFWLHAGLPLLFLNLLPYSKHFHVITAVPNVFLKNMEPAGRLRPMAENAEKLMEIVGGAAEHADPASLPVGVARIEHFTWKAILDFYTCTECGRCSDNCPAHKTGKILSPKHMTLALRDHMYAHEQELIYARCTGARLRSGSSSSWKIKATTIRRRRIARRPIRRSICSRRADPPGRPLGLQTTCRACEEQCPVMISVRRQDRRYAAKPRHDRKGAVPARAPEAVQRGWRVNGNPWNLSRMDRSAWSDGLGIPMMSEKPQAEVLYWVGCAASYDDRAKKIARATAKLMKKAGVDFAILGQEENCTGDPARRAGNEFLFATMAETNAVESLNGYKDQGGMKTVVTTCPHCFNTLKNEYPDFGVKLEVVHHTDFLLAGPSPPQKKLVAKNAGRRGASSYHDSCYLGRYNDVYESPREILRQIPGVELVEPGVLVEAAGLCCGAGGAQMFMGGAEHQPREYQADAPARRHRGDDPGERVPVLHDDAERRAEVPELGREDPADGRRRAPRARVRRRGDRDGAGGRGMMAMGRSAELPRPCPTCKKPAKPRGENVAFPFCSVRCQQVDLGKWLNEEYRVPVEEDDEDPGVVTWDPGKSLAD